MQSAPPPASLVITELSKRYRSASKLALDKLTLSVYPGEVYGFLGPNGAGKSTTIRLLMNFIQPTSGRATILGDHVVTDSVRVKKSVGYLGGEIALYPKMTGQQFLDYMGALQPPVSQAYVKELIKRLQADPASALASYPKATVKNSASFKPSCISRRYLSWMNQPAVSTR